MAKNEDTKGKKNEKEVESLKQQLEEKEKQADEYLNDLKRLQAEFENFMKRTDKEKQQLARFAAKEMADTLVGLHDDMERALTSMDKSSKEDAMKGVEMILKNFTKAMHESGIKPIETIGRKFDPNLHDAIKTVESQEPEDTIVGEFQKGYMFHDRVLRPARVMISGGDE